MVVWVTSVGSLNVKRDSFVKGCYSFLKECIWMIKKKQKKKRYLNKRVNNFPPSYISSNFSKSVFKRKKQLTQIFLSSFKMSFQLDPKCNFKTVGLTSDNRSFIHQNDSESAANDSQQVSCPCSDCWWAFATHTHIRSNLRSFAHQRGETLNSRLTNASAALAQWAAAI